METERPQVLVAEDARTGSGLAPLLTTDGLQVLHTSDGHEALRHAGTRTFDLAVLQVDLPGVDGLQVLSALRSEERADFTPVIVTSDRDDRHARMASYKLGADDFWALPLEPEEILTRVQRCIRLRDTFQAVALAGTQKATAYDELTQLHGRRLFEERLREECKRAQRYDQPLALLLLDSDPTLDRRGELIREVAQCLRQTLRDTDFLARLGGGEFAAVLSRTHLTGALTVAERLAKRLQKLKHVQYCVGLSSYSTRNVMSSEELMRAAVEAVDRARVGGGNRIALAPAVPVFSPSVQVS